jgi:CRISPR-associated exonuclease Cas4
MRLFSIPISEIRQYIFCPRIPYYHLLLGINTEKPIWVKQGKEYHIEQEKLMIRRKFEKIGIKDTTLYFNHNVSSEILGIHGLMDGFLKTDEGKIIPFENKMNNEKHHPAKSHKIQLLAYGLCLEEKLQQKIEYGFIFYGPKGKSFKIDFTDKLRIELNNKLNQLKSMLQKELLPPSSATESQCTQCEYLNLCNDRF